MKNKPMTAQELERIYRENDIEAACKKLGISSPSLYAYLKEMGIPLKGRGGKKRKKLWIIG